MHLSLFTFVTILTTTALANSPCGPYNHASVYAAIQKFCSNAKLIVPSTYSNNGADGNTNGAHVSIIGICMPPQYVPQAYCTAQFLSMCSASQTIQHYGKNKCQIWRIHYGPGPKVVTWSNFAGEGAKTENVPTSLVYDTAKPPARPTGWEDLGPVIKKRRDEKDKETAKEQGARDI